MRATGVLISISSYMLPKTGHYFATLMDDK